MLYGAPAPHMSEEVDWQGSPFGAPHPIRNVADRRINRSARDLLGASDRLSQRAVSSEQRSRRAPPRSQGQPSHTERATKPLRGSNSQAPVGESSRRPTTHVGSKAETRLLRSRGGAPYNGSAHNLQTSPARPDRGTASVANRHKRPWTRSVRRPRSPVPSSANCLSGSGACYTASQLNVSPWRFATRSRLC